LAEFGLTDSVLRADLDSPEDPVRAAKRPSALGRDFSPPLNILARPCARAAALKLATAGGVLVIACVGS
jgi:hypothetical protein